MEELKDISENLTKLYGIEGPQSMASSTNSRMQSNFNVEETENDYEIEDEQTICFPLLSNDNLDNFQAANRIWSCIYLAHLIRKVRISLYSVRSQSSRKIMHNCTMKRKVCFCNHNSIAYIH